jgi:hypothetical protein
MEGPREGEREREELMSLLRSGGDFGRWGLVRVIENMTLKGRVGPTRFLSFFTTLQPPPLPYQRPKSNRAIRLWTETSETMNQNKLFLLFVYLKCFDTATEN